MSKIEKQLDLDSFLVKQTISTTTNNVIYESFCPISLKSGHNIFLPIQSTQCKILRAASIELLYLLLILRAFQFLYFSAEPAKCARHSDCLPSKAECRRRECHCNGYAIGDGKFSCIDGKYKTFCNKPLSSIWMNVADQYFSSF